MKARDFCHKILKSFLVFFPYLINPNKITEDTDVIGEITYIVKLLNDAGYKTVLSISVAYYISLFD